MVATASLLLFVLFINYLRTGQAYDTEQIKNYLKSHGRYKLYLKLLIVTYILKFIMCLVSNPIIMMREFTYVHPPAYNVAYTWVIFYFVEIVVSIYRESKIMKELLDNFGFTFFSSIDDIL